MDTLYFVWKSLLSSNSIMCIWIKTVECHWMMILNFIIFFSTQQLNAAGYDCYFQNDMFGIITAPTGWLLTFWWNMIM